MSRPRMGGTLLHWCHSSDFPRSPAKTSSGEMVLLVFVMVLVMVPLTCVLCGLREAA